MLVTKMVRNARMEEAKRPPLSRIELGDSRLPLFRFSQQAEHKNTDALQDFVFEQLLIDVKNAARTEVYLAEQALKVFGKIWDELNDQ